MLFGEIRYRDHNVSGDRVRIWCDTWAGDAFVLMTREAFAIFENQCRTFGVQLNSAQFDD